MVIEGSLLLDLVAGSCCGAPLLRLNSSKTVFCQGQLEVKKVSQSGLVGEYLLQCKRNPGHKKYLNAGRRVEELSSGAYSINVLTVLSSMLKGEKYDQMKQSYSALGAGKMGYPSYAISRDNIQAAAFSIAEESRRTNLLQISGTYSTDIDVEIDGTWSKRYGHNAKYGVIFAIHAQTNDVIGLSCFSKYCHTCVARSINNQELLQHDCDINWTGSSGAMEKQGFRNIACQVLMENDIRYGSSSANTIIPKNYRL